MAGIYIHIPYCRQKCHYCNFYSVASRIYRDELPEALITELEIRSDFLGKEPVESIYFGGGTPSLLSPDELNRICIKIQLLCQVKEDAEITLEANPDDLDSRKLIELKRTPVNRLSIGIQSFRDADLQYLNRVHTAGQAIRSIRDSLDAGFTNLSIDLIYGIPGLSNEAWLQNLQQLLDFGIPHLSAYALTVEPKTALDVLIRKNKMKPVDEQAIADQFLLLMNFAREHELEHYEISNFCRNHAYARHNTAYWSGKSYLGLGPSAHSYRGNIRQWNVSNMTKYMAMLNQNHYSCESEYLDTTQLYNEYVMLSLRTRWGIDKEKIAGKFGLRYRKYFEKTVIPWLQSGRILESGSVYMLTDEGKLYCDGIAAELFMEE